MTPWKLFMDKVLIMVSIYNGSYPHVDLGNVAHSEQIYSKHLRFV